MLREIWDVIIGVIGWIVVIPFLVAIVIGVAGFSGAIIAAILS